ncbi:AfsR/SARP family transcriptional regulator [Longispora albida]|uniref:AfsR/SARP family transcriptional regulator n=1 Tax=Longispora albida TaxID=203523 RepID=UPI00035D3EFC|nr:BTAD domain-containing putative transcriptional regulator [Longispora albida]
MHFHILGPVEARLAGQPVAFGRQRERKVLAALLVNANRTVPVARLEAVLWGTEPPATARRQVSNSVTTIRRALGDPPIESAGAGYIIRVSAENLDAARFDGLVDQAAGASPVEARPLLAEALGLWRGPALGGLGEDGILAAERARLDERRLLALERRIEADLALGRHDELIGELAALAIEHPLRERLVELHMLALYRAGRRQDSLEIFQQARERLAEQAGLDPRPDLAELHRSILRGAVSLTPPASPVPPAAAPVVSQLPADVPHFTGRDEQLEALDALASGPGPIVIAGSGGMGKTTLAVRWAHRARDLFPDGQLYVNLHGYSTAPLVRPAQVLARFLRALGVAPPEVPAEADEAAALFRSLLTGRRVLVVLDNARTVEHVRPLLPSGPGSLALITSRDRLTGLVARDGARRLDLRVLDSAESLTLLSTLAGEHRVAAEPAAAAELAGYCAFLPLALRVTAARLADHTGRRIAEHLAELRELRLAGLAIAGDPESTVRGAIDLSYQELAPDARRAFRLLGLVPGPDFTVPAVAVLTGSPESEARELLGRLAGACLIDEHQPGRYTFHDLLRAYARERAGEDGDGAAGGRLATWYLLSADAALSRCFPLATRPAAGAEATGVVPVSFTGQEDALAWFDAEYANLRSLLMGTADDQLACRLAAVLRGYVLLRGYTADAFSAAEIGLAAARRVGDVRTEAILEAGLSATCKWLLDLPASARHLESAIALAEAAGWAEAMPDFHNDLAGIRMQQGDIDGAIRHCQFALSLWREQGARDKLGKALIGLAMLQVARGHLPEAEELYTEAIALSREFAAREREASATGGLTYAVMFQGRIEAAMDLARQTFELHRVLGSRRGEALALQGIAEAHLHAGRLDEAVSGAGEMLAIAEEIGYPIAVLDALNLLGTVHLRAGEPALAADLHRRALTLGGERAYTSGRLEALIGLARAQAAAGEAGHALRHAERAVSLSQTSGIRLREGLALVALGEARLAAGEAGPARQAAHAAAESFRATSQWLFEPQASELLNRITAG